VEQWVVRVTGDPRSGEIECEVERVGGRETYLMFTQFKTTLGTNPVLEAVVHDNDMETLGPDDFLSEGECVENAHDWSGGTVRKIHVKSQVIG
jgi:hypothetical protein